MRHKSLKTHDRTKPHIARFYLAIVRLCCLLLLPGPPSIRKSTPLPDEVRTRSSGATGGIASDEQPIGAWRNRVLIARRGWCYRVIRLAFTMHRSDTSVAR